MKRLRHQVVFWMFCLFALPAFAQAKAERITHIKAMFRAINSNKALGKVVLDNEEFFEEGTDRGAQLTGFFDGKRLVKIVAWIGVSDRNYITEYYFENERLIFVYQVAQSFAYDEKKGELDYTRTTKSSEGRYYFIAGHLIDSRTTGENYNHPAGYNPQKELPAEALKYLTLLRSKHK